MYLYYEIKNFYQNHRRYVKSRDAAQLRGESTVGSEDCGSQRFQASDTTRPILPCGLSAWSMFNDTYTISIPNSVALSSKINIFNCTQSSGEEYCNLPILGKSELFLIKVSYVENVALFELFIR